MVREEDGSPRPSKAAKTAANTATEAAVTDWLGTHHVSRSILCLVLLHRIIRTQAHVL